MTTSSSYVQDDDALYEVCSIASSTETADNLPGPGRLLGNLYSHLGVRLENRIEKIAVKLHGTAANPNSLQYDDALIHGAHSVTNSTESGYDANELAVQLPTRPPSPQDVDVAYEICSFASSNETADNLPGPGRLLGNLYSLVGTRIENRLGKVAVRLGRGPAATTMKIQRIRDDQSLGYFARRRQLRKNCNRLVRYMR